MININIHYNTVFGSKISDLLATRGMDHHSDVLANRGVSNTLFGLLIHAYLYAKICNRSMIYGISVCDIDMVWTILWQAKVCVRYLLSVQSPHEYLGEVGINTVIQQR